MRGHSDADGGAYGDQERHPGPASGRPCSEEVFNKDGLFDELKKALAERVLNAELDDHLESEAPAGRRNDRNGHSKKTVLTETAKLGSGEDEDGFYGRGASAPGGPFEAREPEPTALIAGGGAGRDEPGGGGPDRGMDRQTCQMGRGLRRSRRRHGPSRPVSGAAANMIARRLGENLDDLLQVLGEHASINRQDLIAASARASRQKGLSEAHARAVARTPGLPKELNRKALEPSIARRASHPCNQAYQASGRAWATHSSQQAGGVNGRPRPFLSQGGPSWELR